MAAMGAILDDREGWLQAFREGWLAHYEQTGETNWKLYNSPKNETTISGPGIDLSRARLALVTTAGGYLRDSQEPFDAPNVMGDYSIRTFPVSTPLEALAFAHDHYDHTAVNADPQVLVPLRHLADLAREGVIGELAPTVVSYSGYQPWMTRTIDELFPQVLAALKEQNVQAALLVPS